MNITLEEILMVIISFLIGWFLRTMIGSTNNNKNTNVKLTTGKHARNVDGRPHDWTCENYHSGTCSSEGRKKFSNRYCIDNSAIDNTTMSPEPVCSDVTSKNKCDMAENLKWCKQDQPPKPPVIHICPGTKYTYYCDIVNACLKSKDYCDRANQCVILGGKPTVNFDKSINCAFDSFDDCIKKLDCDISSVSGVKPVDECNEINDLKPCIIGTDDPGNDGKIGVCYNTGTTHGYQCLPKGDNCKKAVDTICDKSNTTPWNGEDDTVHYPACYNANLRCNMR
jgi:hypothetical protein